LFAVAGSNKKFSPKIVSSTLKMFILFYFFEKMEKLLSNWGRLPLLMAGTL